MGKSTWRLETVAAGNDEPRLARVAPDGTEDTAFNKRAQATVKQGVYAVRRIKDGRILVGGVATIARLLPNGDPDRFFVTPPLKSTVPQRPFAVRVIRPLKDGKILVGGDFVTPNGAAGLARLLADGQIDGAFDRNLGAGFRAAERDHRGVTGIVVQKDGKILVTGSFDSVGGTAQRTLARLNPDGTLDRYPAIAEVGLR